MGAGNIIKLAGRPEPWEKVARWAWSNRYGLLIQGIKEGTKSWKSYKVTQDSAERLRNLGSKKLDFRWENEFTARLDRMIGDELDDYLALLP